MVYNTFITSPLDQFEIRDFFIFKLLNFNLSFTNMGLYLTMAGSVIIFVGFIARNNNKLAGNS